MSEVKHTPTPWAVEPGVAPGSVTIRSTKPGDGKPVAEIWLNGDDPAANADFIVRAANSHRQLVSVLKLIKRGLEQGSIKSKAIMPRNAPIHDLIEDVDAALALAEAPNA